MGKVEIRSNPRVEDSAGTELRLGSSVRSSSGELLCLRVDCHLEELLIPHDLGD